MSSEEQWTDGFEDAWDEFREELVRAMGRLGEHGLISLEVMASESQDGGCAPYVQLLYVAGHGILGEVSSNAYLAQEHRLDPKAEELLQEIGWNEPDDRGDDADPSDANYWWPAEPLQIGWLAQLAVRALREVFGVVHPSFLETSGLDQPAVAARAEEEPAAFPSSHDELVALVDNALLPVLEEVPVKDSDGDVPIRFGESVVFVQVVATEPAVDLFSVLVTNVDDAPRALTEVNILNRDPGGFRFTVSDGVVLARQRLSGHPFVAEQLREALGRASATIDELAGDLIARVGGHTFYGSVTSPVADPQEPERRPVSSRTWMQTVLNLEEDEPGSVDPQLAAHIFQHDQVAILEQITRQRRNGRPEMVALLRGALRVVVESEFESASGSAHS